MPVREIEIDPHNQKRKLFFWVKNPGRIDDLEKWVADQPHNERDNLIRLLRRCLSHTEPLLHHSDESFKKEFDNKNESVWAIKSYQIRLLGVFKKLDFYVIHYLRKKSRRLSKEDIKAAKAKHDKYFDNNGK